MEYNYYKILGVHQKASDAELKVAFREMAKKFHPDRNKAPDSHTFFQVLNEAYQTLSDPVRRFSYDQKLGYKTILEEPQAAAKRGSREWRMERRKRNAEYSHSIHKAPEMWEPHVIVKFFFYCVALAFGSFTMYYSGDYILNGLWSPVMLWVPLLGFLIFLDALSGMFTGQPVLTVKLFSRLKQRFS